jgi:hypothetical protein
MAWLGLFAKAGEKIAEGAAHKIEGSAIKDAFKTGKTYTGEHAIGALDLADPAKELNAKSIQGITTDKMAEAKSAIATELNQNLIKMKSLKETSPDEYKALVEASEKLKIRVGELDHLDNQRLNLAGKGLEYAKNNKGSVAINGLMLAPMASGLLPSSSADAAAAAGGASKLADAPAGVYPAGGQVPEAYGQPAVAATQMSGVKLPADFSSMNSPAGNAALGISTPPSALDPMSKVSTYSPSSYPPATYDAAAHIL